ncbi:hypothetical protein AsAng_0024010 [Aureispira anguillae]|uniref:Uncharacterized protein n=1 Tax=Aureispira anguillae TaxID=2864201 RepID=A0A915YEK3_9BACT|nr:hypothetical protein AsAng_0024010 [Aureispira anguillae]
MNNYTKNASLVPIGAKINTSLKKASVYCVFYIKILLSSI